MLDGASSKDTHLEQINTCNGRAANESGTLRSEFTKDGYHSGEWSPPLQRKNREFSFDRLGGFHRIAQLGLVVIGGFPNSIRGPTESLVLVPKLPVFRRSLLCPDTDTNNL
jgi:hypothetical protein